MTHDGSGGDAAGRADLREEERVRLEFAAASYGIWIRLARLLGTRWDSQALAYTTASRIVRELSELAKLRCLPDARPLAASLVFDELHARVSQHGRTPKMVVEGIVVRELAGEPRILRTPAEITELIEVFLRRYAGDYERGELTWVDELYAMAAFGEPARTWTLEVSPTHEAGGDATVMLCVPVAALEAAGLLKGDHLVLEPRWDGLWIGRA